ncbi:MAG: hypothetical protein ABIJ50_09770 [Pseudomonadota bacterium]
MRGDPVLYDPIVAEILPVTLTWVKPRKKSLDLSLQVDKTNSWLLSAPLSLPALQAVVTIGYKRLELDARRIQHAFPCSA